MAATISELEFRSQGCLYLEAAAREPPFTQQGAYNPNYNPPPKRQRPLKILGPDDTFHDLSKARTGYNPDFFNNNVSGYLMTDLPAAYRSGNVLTFKREINFPSFLTLPSTLSYENKVATTFEQEYTDLRPATEITTYAFILDNFDGATILAPLVDIIIRANGGLVINPGEGFQTFDNYISQFDDTGSPTRSQVKVILSSRTLSNAVIQAHPNKFSIWSPQHIQRLQDSSMNEL
jgi:hypothetical protein